MVFSAKMLEKTGAPLNGQPTPVVGTQFGEEKGRRPTKLSVVPPGTVVPFGSWKSLPSIPTKPAGTVNWYWESSPKEPQLWPGIELISRQVVGLARLTS